MVFRNFFSPWLAPGLFALGIALRALAIAALGFAGLYLIVTTHFYASALILIGAMLLTVLDMARILTRLDAPMTRVMEALMARAHEFPLGSTEHFVAGGAVVSRTIGLLQAERKEHGRQTAYLQCLADTVSAALIVVEADGAIGLANRAAQMLAGDHGGGLDAIAAIGPEAARELLALTPGARRIVKLANGQQMLASMAAFSAPGRGGQRLLALQTIVGELDAVELKAWRDMTRVLAHEMMNSLTPISSLSESLSGLVGTPGTQQDVIEAVDIIGRRSQGLMNFVERYRKIADLPAPRLQPIMLGEFVQGLDTLMGGIMARAGIAYSYSVTPPDLVLAADAELLSQAVINLLHNAVDAVAGRGHPAISLTCSRSAAGIAIAVADNGVGLAPGQSEDIFVPFFTTKPGGSGIGLSLARQIALVHGGAMEVEANGAQGAIFRIVLPPQAK